MISHVIDVTLKAINKSPVMIPSDFHILFKRAHPQKAFCMFCLTFPTLFMNSVSSWYRKTLFHVLTRNYLFKISISYEYIFKKFVISDNISIPTFYSQFVQLASREDKICPQKIIIATIISHGYLPVYIRMTYTVYRNLVY